MTRLSALALLLASLAACSEDSPDRPRSAAQEPEFPTLIEAGSRECDHCTSEAGAKRGQSELADACAFDMRYECPSGGSCSRPIPCDASCCPPASAPPIGLDEPPWGPVLAAAASDPRPPSGVLVQHAGPHVSLLRPGLTQSGVTTILRAPVSIEAWRWAAGPRQLVLQANQRLHRFDLATQTITEIPGIEMSYGGFDVDGERLAAITEIEARAERRTLLTMTLGTDTPAQRWVMTPGSVTQPDWQPNGSSLLLSLQLGPPGRFRLADPAAQTHVDSPKDLGELLGPFWHPSGSFLGVWRRAQSKCTLLWIEPDGQHHAETPLTVDQYDCPITQFSPDGRHLVMLVERETSSLRAVEIVTPPNWSERRLLSEHGVPSLQWLDDAAAEPLATVAGFVASCETCRDSPMDSNSPAPARALGGSEIANVIAQHAKRPLPGGLISFASRVDGRPQVHAIAPNGGKARVLTNMDPGAIGPCFSPDGQGLVFVTSDHEQLGVIDLAEGTIYRPETWDELKLGIPEWSHDGTTLAAAAIQTTGNSASAEIWTWKFLFDHWGTVAQDKVDLRGSIDARPSWAPGLLLAHGARSGWDLPGIDHVEIFDGTTPAKRLGDRLPRMIAPVWHPSSRFFAAWVGAGGRYQLAWVAADGSAWFDTGVRYDAIGTAADVAEPATVAFDPSGSHVAFTRPDLESGELVITIAAITNMATTTTLAQVDGDLPDLSWSAEGAAKHVAAAELPYSTTKPVPKARRPEPYWGDNLNTILLQCRRAHSVAFGTSISLYTRSIGETGKITEAEVRGELKGTPFATCVQAKVLEVGFDPFIESEHAFTFSFKLTEKGAGSAF